jgi:hypothetical protein
MCDAGTRFSGPNMGVNDGRGLRIVAVVVPLTHLTRLEASFALRRPTRRVLPYINPPLPRRGEG